MDRKQKHILNYSQEHKAGDREPEKVFIKHNKKQRRNTAGEIHRTQQGEPGRITGEEQQNEDWRKQGKQDQVTRLENTRVMPSAGEHSR